VSQLNRLVVAAGYRLMSAEDCHACSVTGERIIEQVRLEGSERWA
jgi:hypothetical protein